VRGDDAIDLAPLDQPTANYYGGDSANVGVVATSNRKPPLVILYGQKTVGTARMLV